jgi:hypothetical protein
MTKKDINSTLAIIAAVAAGVPMDAGRVFVEASKGNGSGRTTKCKRCGAVGAVEMGPNGKRHIAGCNC